MMRIDILGQPRVKAILEALEASLNTVEILDESGAVLLARTRARYLQEVDPDGHPWMPSLAALNRLKKGRGGGTLYNYGKLFHSIQLAGSGENERFIGTDVPYGKYHQEGNGDMYRPFLGFNYDDVSVVQKLIIKRVTEKQNGLA